MELNLLKRKRSVIALVAIIAIAIFGVVTFKQYRSTVSLNKIRADRQKRLRSGTRSLLPGPYLTPGDPKSLKFETIDLGLTDGHSVQISDKGDVLYRWSGDGNRQFDYIDGLGKKATSVRNPFPNYRLRRSDRKITDFKAKRAFLAPNGVVTAITSDKAGYRLEQNGKVVLDPSNPRTSSQPNLILKNVVAATNDLLFLDTKSKGIDFYLDADFVLKRIDLSRNQSVQILGMSKSETYLRVQEQGAGELGSPSFAFAKFRDGKIELQASPPECPNPTQTITKECLYLTPDGTIADSIIHEFRYGKVTKLPSLPNSVRMSILSANSSREFIVDSLEMNPNLKLRKFVPYKSAFYFVSKGAFYSLASLRSALNLPEVPYSGVSEKFTIMEDGKILAILNLESGPHLYLLIRKG